MSDDRLKIDTLILSSYVKVADHGLALPLYGFGQQPNLWYSSVSQIVANGSYNVVNFEASALIPDELIEPDCVVEQGVGESLIYIFHWEDEVYIGTAQKIYAQLESVKSEIVENAPLSLLDIATFAGSLDQYHLECEAKKYLKVNFGSGVSSRWYSRRLIEATERIIYCILPIDEADKSLSIEVKYNEKNETITVLNNEIYSESGANLRIRISEWLERQSRVNVQYERNEADPLRLNIISNAARIKLLFEQAKTSEQKGDVETAIANIQESENLDTTLNTLKDIVFYYVRLGRLDLAENICIKRLAGADINSKIHGDISEMLGQVYQRQGKILEAINSVEIAAQVFREYGSTYDVAHNRLILGELNFSRLDLPRAKENFQYALEGFTAVDSKIGLARTYGNMANLAEYVDNFDYALELIEKAILLYKENGDMEGVAIQHGNMGNIYFRLLELAEAERHYQEAYEINVKLNRKSGIAVQQSNIGKVLLHKGDYTRAIDLINESLQLQREIGNFYEIAAQLSNLGFALMRVGKINEAKACLTEAKSISDQHDYRNIREMANSILNLMK